MDAARRADGRLTLARGALALLALVAVPLVWSVARTVSFLPSAREWQLWWPSVLLAAQAACVSLVIALAAHWATNMRRKAGAIWTALAVTTACALPSYVHALAWSWFLPMAWLSAERTVTVFVLGVSYAAVTFLVLFVALRMPSRKMLEAAWMAGLPPTRAYLLVARRAVPALLAAWLIAFLLSFADFPVADHFRVPTYATEVFARVAAWLDIAAAARLALPMLVIAILCTAVLARAFSQMQADSMTVADDRAVAQGVGTLVARGCAGAICIALIAGVPVAILIQRVPSFATLAAAFRALQPDLAGTLVLGAVSGLLTTMLGATLSYMGARRILVSERFGRPIAWAALAWPASLLCLGALSLATLPLFRFGGLEWLPLVLVLLVRWTILPYEIWSNFWLRTPVSLEESAWMTGIPWSRALVRLLREHAAAPLAASVLLTACFAVNDLTVFVLLAPPGFSTTTLNIFSAAHYGASGYLAALCLCQVMVVALLAAAAVLWKFEPSSATR